MRRLGLFGIAWVDRMLSFWSPGWTVGGCLTALAVAISCARPLARRMEVGRIGAAVYVGCIGITLAVTLSPRSPDDTYFVFESTERACEIVPWQRDPADLVISPEWLFNLLLLSPAGFVSGTARSSSRRRTLLAAAAFAPVVVEVTQYGAVQLYRSCQGLDVVTNWSGLALGCVVATALAARRRRRIVSQARRGGDGDRVAEPLHSG